MTEEMGGPSAHDWAVCTPRLRALDLDFAVRCTDPVIGRYLAHVLSPFEAEGPPAVWWSVVVSSEPNRLSEVWIGEALSGRRRSPHRVVGHVLWRLNKETIRRSSDRYILFHASAAAHHGRGIAFPASMESGKTTLVAGLLRRGLHYVTDEAVAIDPDTLLAHPFPKALSIDPGSWDVLADLRPVLDPAAEPIALEQWHVPVDDVGGGTVPDPVPIEFFVFPRYEAGGRTELTPMRRAEAHVTLAENSFNATGHGRRGFDAMAESVRRARCYRLAVSDLDHACDLVIDLFAT